MKRTACFALFLALCLALAHVRASRVEHIVVLMLENRSFDHFLGFLKQNDSRIEGCLPSGGDMCSNPADPTVPNSPRTSVNGNAVYRQISDPHHSFEHTLNQVYGYGPSTVDPAPMTGFIKDYDNHELIMACFEPSHIPASAALASEFAVFDYWHAAIPGPTEVNRLYANSATSRGTANNDDIYLAIGYPQRTIFESIDESAYNRTWATYFELFPTTAFFTYTRKLDNLHKFKLWEEFEKDAASGNLPNYAWLEPNYFDMKGFAASDMHPDHDVSEGDRLIKSVYETLRNGPKWNSTMLVVTFDEHGGFFDHVSPPINVPNPDGRDAHDVTPTFDFSRLGVRVPTIVASPLIPKGTVVGKAANTSYSHSSLPATVRALLTPDQPFLTKRDAWSAPFESILSLAEPRTDCPTSLPDPPSHRDLYPDTLKPVQELGTMWPITDLQKTMVAVASALNNDGQVTETGETMTEGEAAEFIEQQVSQWLGGRPARSRGKM